ncbi:MBL fold metallo-hydrolase [Streptomyces sp. NPDC059928]|uniref:MBL fold metallo-hydrolase n=1 Tax=unclassified Streptomyces TaxID=2593676 RepID=UPI00364EE3A8
MTSHLRPLSDSTRAWLHNGRTGWGWSNCGVVASEGTALLVDTQFTLAATRHLLNAVTGALPGVRIETVVNSHQNGDHTWGNQLLPDAEIVTSSASAAHLCHEMNPAQLTALCQAEPSSAVVSYAAKHFGGFDFTGVEVIPATRTFTGREEVKVGTVLVELLDLGPGHSAGDVAVHVPDEGVLFAGDAIFSGMHMVVWSGSLDACVRSCQSILDTEAETIVPGHGPVLDRVGVTEFRDYLLRVGESANAYARAGVPLDEASRRVFHEHGRSWAHPERLYTATAGAYRDAGIQGVPEGTFALVEGMAGLAA